MENIDKYELFNFHGNLDVKHTIEKGLKYPKQHGK